MNIKFQTIEANSNTTYGPPVGERREGGVKSLSSQRTHYIPNLKGGFWKRGVSILANVGLAALFAKLIYQANQAIHENAAVHESANDFIKRHIEEQICPTITSFAKHQIENQYCGWTFETLGDLYGKERELFPSGLMSFYKSCVEDIPSVIQTIDPEKNRSTAQYGPFTPENIKLITEHFLSLCQNFSYEKGPHWVQDLENDLQSSYSKTLFQKKPENLYNTETATKTMLELIAWSQNIENPNFLNEMDILEHIRQNTNISGELIKTILSF